MIAKSKILKGVSRPFEFKGFEGVYAIAAGIILFGGFIITVILSLIFSNQYLVSSIMIVIIVSLLSGVFHLNQNYSVKEIDIILSNYKRPKNLKN